MTRLPFGSTSVTTAAMVRVICSWRVMPPVPPAARLELVLTALAGSNPLGMILDIRVSSPKKLVTPAVLALVRDALVALVVLALSSILISTVRMSPTRLARWSSKKARAPLRHSELAEAGWGSGSRARAAIDDDCGLAAAPPG